LTQVGAPLFLALGFLGGRFDHSFSALNVIARFPEKRVILFGLQDVVLRVPEQISLTVPVGTPIALLPMGPARVWTTGLKWDMKGAALAPNGIISSSNKASHPKVEIRTEGPVLLTLPKMFVDGLTAAVLAR